MALAPTSSRGQRLGLARIALGTGGLAVAVAVRVEVAGAAGSHSARAGLVFALVLVILAGMTARQDAALADLSGWRAARLALLGTLGAGVLCVPAALRNLVFTGGAVSLSISTAGFWSWAAVVTIVAIAEESLLRGSLYRTLDARFGMGVAITVTSVAFALLHVPVYGLQVLPLDLAVGIWLGALRAVSGSVAVPAAAHVLADLAGWWLR